ncbi:hypothetical protein [Flavobacterium sp. 245]|uniref:hypothetical protein n=1 Tax=Flavobacterium sp. 245 TaxID=2512115 RepID=UPI0010622351|nr:hypothetical protein [Flavobacterium sp. 245]TDP04210.1 hypothetical protein EV145_101612 [Flavobacterium sp. 245]
MKKKNLFLILLILCSSLISAQSLKPEYQKCIQSFIDNVKGDRKEALAEMVFYPLKREYPIPDIVDKTDFINRYSEIFDSTLKKEITASNPEKNWSDMGWRGMMLNKGNVWLDFDGRVTSINYQSKAENDRKKKLNEAQKKELHSSVAFFQKPICILETSKFKIRIDNLGHENYRYASWSINKKMIEEPDLVINGGVLIIEGSGGNHQYEFKKDQFTYTCDIIVLATKDSPPARLIITQNGKEILKQDATIVPR